MQYLVDGHNLIGKISDIDLDDPDDEVKLVLRLRSWSARGRKRKVTVVFDYGLPGGDEKGLSTGPVKVVFAPAGRTADSLLMSRIRKVKNPAEYTLVSSDLRIIQLAESCRILVWRSESFAARMDEEREQSMVSSSADAVDDPQVSVDEIDMWLDIFTGGEDERKGK